MNKSDFALIGFLIVIISLIFIFLYFGNNKKVNNAIVYYEDKEILKIDLSKDKIYPCLLHKCNGESSFNTFIFLFLTLILTSPLYPLTVYSLSLLKSILSISLSS